MEHQDLLPKAREDPIGSATTVEEIVAALAKRGCTDLTSSINLDACSNFPCAGGGFCDVYRGALNNGARIAIKSLRFYNRSEAEADSDGRKMIKRAARELYHWSKLRHQNVLPLMGLAFFRGQISMISEWMDNGSLMSYLRLKPDADRKRLCMDVCEGLCYIHANEMAHGDLKAANVMVSSQGVAMIADFGNAQLKDLTLKFSNTTKSGFSVRWAAPELLLEDSGPQVSKEADVYAYGMTMLEVMTGKVPYEGTNDIRILILVAVEKKVPPRANVNVGDDVWDLLNSCWIREPSKRPKITIVKDRLQILFWPASDAQLIEGAGESGAASPSVSDASTIGSVRRQERDDSDKGDGRLRQMPKRDPAPAAVKFKWVKGQVIGRGTFGRVYHAMNLTTGEMIAVKQVELPQTDNDRADARQISIIDALKAEGDVLRGLNHPHIVQCLGVEETTDTFSVFLEYLPGGSIGSMLRKFGRFEDGVVRSFSRQVIDAVAYLHNSGILHRDLKGDNILVDPSGTCKVSDFGISKRIGSHLSDGAELIPLSEDVYNNHEGTAMQGSVFWMAPEMLHNDKRGYSAKIDIWSVGCLVLEMQTGQRPWAGEDMFGVMYKVGGLRQAPPIPGDVRMQLTPLADDFREKCFTIDPGERPTAAELLTHPWLEVSPG